jgi:lysophospholipase L1-like esterase
VAVDLARTGGSLRYANLAVRGRLLDQVIATQLPVALELAPDLVSFHAGPNDVLRPRADVPALLARYDAAVGRLAAAGIRTILFTVVEQTGTGRTANRLAGRFHAFNVGVRATAERHGAVLVDLAAVPVLRDRRLWHEDRLHLAPEGHARVAAAVLEALEVGQSDWWRSELPGSARASRATALAADVRWIRVHLLPWIGRRIRGVSSGDRVTAKHVELVDIVPD